MRLVIIEDHLMFRDILVKVCRDELGHDIAGVAGNGEAAVALITATKPDVILLDLQLPQLDGFEVIEQTRANLPQLKVLILSSHCDDYTVYRAERARVHGFVDKNTNTVETLKSALSEIGHGRIWFSDTFKALKVARHNDAQAFDKILGDREREVLMLIGQLLGDHEIARHLSIAPATVEKHRFNILRKLGLKTTPELVRYAQEHGFTLSPPNRPLLP